jgi:hypothetical protein
VPETTQPPVEVIQLNLSLAEVSRLYGGLSIGLAYAALPGVPMGFGTMLLLGPEDTINARNALAFAAGCEHNKVVHIGPEESKEAYRWIAEFSNRLARILAEKQGFELEEET